MKYQPGVSVPEMPTPKKLMELQATINEDLLKARLPEIRIEGFRLPEQALEITFERETVTGENRERLWDKLSLQEPNERG